MGQSIDLSFMSVSTGSISGEYKGIEFTYRIPKADEEDKFNSIQFRQLTDGRSLTDAMSGKAAKKDVSDKVIEFSKLPLNRFKALCTGWSPAFQLNGSDLNFSPEAVQQIVDDLPKLAQQVDTILWAKYQETLEEEQGN